MGWAALIVPAVVTALGFIVGFFGPLAQAKRQTKPQELHVGQAIMVDAIAELRAQRDEAKAEADEWEAKFHASREVIASRQELLDEIQLIHRATRLENATLRDENTRLRDAVARLGQTPVHDRDDDLDPT